MSLRFLKMFLLFGIILFASGCASATQPKSSEPAGKIKVVAAENFYGEVAEAVGGDKVQVVSILNDGVMEPENFNPTPQQAKDIADAQIIIYNGLGYDAWVEKLLSSSNKESRKSVAVARDILGLKAGDNPHVWYNIDTMPKLASALAEEMAKIDSQNAELYRKNAENYVKTLQPLLQKVESLRQTNPVPVETTETIFEYMSQKLNLVPQTPNFALSIFNGVDPAPGDLIQMEKNLKEKRVKLLIYNSRTKNQDVERLVQVAKSSGIPVVSVTEQKPSGKTYLTWMMDQLNELEGALNGK